MTTSLAEQLQRLAVPQTSLLKRDKKRASLLFEPKEAAGIKRETFYQIGLEGLEELISKNEQFGQFQDTLFNPTSKDYERAVQNVEANKLLDKNIKKFLLLLSPYFLINCSHKALEWLINRYMINEYNREDLLMLILPYHESNIFVRVLQLLNFKDHNDSWYFLKSLQKPGIHLTKNALFNHAASNSNCLKFVANFITQLLKVHEKPNLLAVAFNFYCVVYTGAIEYSNKISDDQLTHLLPCLVKGLGSNIPDFCAATYIILARLVAKAVLNEKVLDVLVEKISNVLNPSLRTESCLVLLVLYQSQTEYKKVPEKAIQNFAKNHQWLSKELQGLNNTGSYIYSFLEHLISSSVTCTLGEGSGEVKEMVNTLLQNLKLDNGFVEKCLHAVLDPLHISLKYPVEVKTWLTEIVQTLERQYPTPFDKAVYKIMSNGQDVMKKRKKCLHKILKNTMTYKGKFELIENLCHSNEECRAQAIVYLKKNYDAFNDTDKEIIKNLLVDRLNDDNHKIIKKTLEIVEGNNSIFDKVALKDILITLLKKSHTRKHPKILEKVLSLLISLDDGSNWEIFIALFPYLHLKSDEDFHNYQKLLMTYLSKHPLLNKFQKSLAASKDCKDFSSNIMTSLQANNDLSIVTVFVQTLQNIPDEKQDNLHKYISSLILSAILPKNSSIEISTMILETVFNYINSSTKKENNDHTQICNCIDVANEDKLPMGGLIQCVENILSKTTPTKTDLSISDFTKDNNNFYVILINILLMQNKKYSTLILKILNDLCPDWQKQIEFILNICVSENGILEESSKQAALNLVQSLVSTEEVMCKDLTNINSLVVPYLLILLNHTDDDIRKVTSNILNILCKSSEKKIDNYIAFLEVICEHEEEIVLDSEQIPLITYNIIAPENTKGKKHVRELNCVRKELFNIVCKESNPSYLQSGILNILSFINNIELFEQTCKKAIPLLAVNSELNNFESIIVVKNIRRIDQNVCKKVSENSNVWKFMELALNNEKTAVYVDEKKFCPAVLVINQLEKEILGLFNELITKNILGIITHISTFAQNPDILPACSRIFKHIDLDVNLIIEHLTRMKDVQSPKVDASKKKRRVSVVPTIDILDTQEWKKGVTILEFIQDKKKMRNTNLLLPLLFDILKKCLDFDEQAAVEYPKQLILSLILHCCTKLEDKNLPKNIFNMELIVQCIRASQNPQTHHHALLVLAHTAQLVPTQVLHHIMAIFTFMGSSVLRHDDAYSFQIITKIIDTIIPILIHDKCEATIAKVLRVFVDALLDVPEHRRLPLYSQLMLKIDAKENLYLFLLLVFESHVLHNTQEKQRSVKGIDTTPRRLDIAANLARQFSPDIVIYSCIKLIKYLKELPNEKDEHMETDEEPPTFEIITHTPKQFRHYKYTLLTFASSLLASKEFVDQIAQLADVDLLNLEQLYKEAIINILTYIQRISKVTDKNVNTPQAQYWKVILHHSYDILDCINALLTPEMFILVFKGLMVHNINTVRRRALELLNTKLQYSPTFFEDCNKNEIYTLIPPILTILETLNNEKLDQEQELIIQTALLCLKLLTKTMAAKDPERFVKILDFITVLIKSGKAQNNVQASVVLCLAELCANLRAHAISNLQDFIPVLIKILKSQRHQDTPGLLLLSVVTALDKILDCLSLFLSPYLQKLLFELSILSCKWTSDGEAHKIQPKLNMIRQKIGSVIPSRVLIPAIEKCYDDLIEKRHFSAISSLMDTLGENLGNLKGADINTNLPELTSFFLNALQFRSNGKCNLQEANSIEEHIIKSLTILILKLSEGNFRPLYYKLYDWATRGEVKCERVITFYGLSCGIAQSLKGLFVLFAGHFLNNASQVLDSCNKIKNEKLYFEDDEKNILLLGNILKTLHAIFLYDTQKFVNKDRFEVLMQPIIDQLENTIGGIHSLKKRNEEILTPCIVQFALAVADDSLWKQMNYQILLKMRDTSSEIRLIALYCLTQLVKKLGEDFLPLLPETIPFLAELLEDEEENVEKACKTAVQEMEKVLGESLQKYF